MAEKKIMLVCAAGMSTSMLVTRMQKAAEKMDFRFIFLLQLPLMQTTNWKAKNQMS